MTVGWCAEMCQGLHPALPRRAAPARGSRVVLPLGVFAAGPRFFTAIRLNGSTRFLGSYDSVMIAVSAAILFTHQHNLPATRTTYSGV